jgi:DNA-binding beta-propeller fold protein YncE
LYVTNSNNNTIAAYNAAGVQQFLPGGSFPSLNTPLGISYSATTSSFYVTNLDNFADNGSITVYNASGALQSLPSGFPSSSLNQPAGIVLAP